MTDKELARQRYANSVRLLTTWEDIVLRYKDLPADEDDEIDLRTGKLVRDRGKLKKMKGTRRFGFFSGFLVGGEEEAEVEDEEGGDEEGDEPLGDDEDDDEPSISRKRRRRSRSAAAGERGGSVGPSSRSRQPSLTPSAGFFAARTRPQMDPADLKAFLAENEVLMADFVDEEDDFSGIDEVTVYGGETDRESVYGRTDVESGNDSDDSDEEDRSDIQEQPATTFRSRIGNRGEVASFEGASGSKRVEESSESEEDATEEARIERTGRSRKGKKREIEDSSRRSSITNKRRRRSSNNDYEEESPSAPNTTTKERGSQSGRSSPLSPAKSPPSISNADFEPILPDRPTVPGFPVLHWHHVELPKITDLPVLKLKDIYAPNVRYGTSSWTSISPHILFNLPRDYDPVNVPIDRPHPFFNEEIQLPGGAVVYAPSRQVIKTREEVSEAATRDAQKRRRMKNVERERKLAERREQEKREREALPKLEVAPLKRTAQGKWVKKEEPKEEDGMPSIGEIERRNDASSSRGGPSASNRPPLPPSNPPLPSTRITPLPPSNLAATTSWAAELASLLEAQPSPPSLLAPPPALAPGPSKSRSKPRLSVASTSNTIINPTNSTNKPYCHNCLSFGRDLVAAVCPGRQTHLRCTGGDPKVVQLAYPGRCLRCLFQGREEESKTCLGGRLGNQRCDKGGGEISRRTRMMKEREEKREKRGQKKKKGGVGVGEKKGKGKGKVTKKRKVPYDDEDEEEEEEEMDFDDEHETTDEEEEGGQSGAKILVASSSKRKTRSSARFRDGSGGEEGDRG
ncbi:hypothetical protein BDY24DRAFT_13412 [Mrakia frigida]|uniref:uncharacterized protein n=1 Tax=Mrakia frigida TaxID=29902 RepID=UPI003FCBF11B